jgi:hypothetical protein
MKKIVKGSSVTFRSYRNVRKFGCICSVDQEAGANFNVLPFQLNFRSFS